MGVGGGLGLDVGLQGHKVQPEVVSSYFEIGNFLNFVFFSRFYTIKIIFSLHVIDSDKILLESLNKIGKTLYLVSQKFSQICTASALV